MRRIIVPPTCRAASQLYSAVRAPPMWRAPVGDGAKRTRMTRILGWLAVLIGAHVSPAGGPAKAVERGVEKGARAIQIFNQNPRAWRPREYSDEEVAAYHEAVEASDADALLIHAVYLLNCASEAAVLREKSLTALTVALRAGAARRARVVVVRAGSAKVGGVGPAVGRAGATSAGPLVEGDGCALHRVTTAGTRGTLSRSFAELAAMLQAAGGE